MEGGGKKRLATLVGCNYANTPHALSGCINDVHAMRALLLSRFGFAPTDVVLLTDDPAALDSSALPTGANIRAALAAMINRAEPGDVLFFHYSGHGTLIPSVKPHHGWHRRDEAIVPCDFNLLTDVDFRQLVDRLPAGASFTMVSDSCHSGGLIDKEKEQIGPATVAAATAKSDGAIRRTLRMLPFESVLSYLTSLSGIESPHVGDHLVELFGEAASGRFRGAAEAERCDGGILLSGCQTNETSADMSPFDAAVADGKSYGAFSNAIRVVLGEKEGVAVSNRELVMAAREVLCKQGFFEQHPCLYCSDNNADAPFLWQPPEQQQHLHASM